MPCLVPAIAGSDLTQGDILKDVPFLLVSKAEGAPAFVDKAIKHVLVVTRACQALRSKTVVVAPIKEFGFNIRDALKGDEPGRLEKARKILGSFRDGISGLAFSDSLYLGELPGQTARMAANLASLTTVEVPTVVEERNAWIASKRIATLDTGLARDLHTRLVLTYTRLGFDDYGWYSDADLELMITIGTSEAAQIQASVLALEEAQTIATASAKALSAEEKKRLERLREDHSKALERLRPYEDEATRRKK